MPASMMIPPAGSILKVSGNSSAMVAAGPSPGMMPTIVPSRQPTKHQMTLPGCSATANPCRRPDAMSISEPEWTGGERYAQCNGEDQVEGKCGRDCDDARSHERPPERDGHEKEREQREADQEAQELHERDREREGKPGHHRPAGRGPVHLRFAVVARARRIDDQQQREHHHGDAIPEREEARAWTVEGIVIPGA